MRAAQLSRLQKYHRSVVDIIRRMPAPASVHALRALNFILRSRDNYIVSTNYGFQMICSPRDLIQVCILQFGHWEPNISAVIESLLSPGVCAADIGANVGYDTLLMSKAVGPDGKVIAFEASPRTFVALQKNITLNDSANVRALNLAISDTAGEVNLYSGDPTNSGNASIAPSSSKTLEGAVKVLPLYSALLEDERDRLEFVKIDVEGAEAPIMRDLLRNIFAFPALSSVLVEISSVEDPRWDEIFASMRANGFEAYAVENEYTYLSYIKWRKPAPIRPISTVPELQADVLFTRVDVARLL